MFLKKLIATSNDSAGLIGRLMLALVIFPHGAQKMLGWFGGFGYDGTMGFFAQMGIPPVFAFLAIMAEFLGALGLVFGLLGRVASFGILCNMVVAILMVHWPQGFFMNWGGTQGGEGYEFHLLAIGLAVTTIIRGSGAFSLDLWLTRRWQASGALSFHRRDQDKIIRAA